MDAMRNCVAVYPGTFDPLTNGHVSLVRRAAKVFGSVIVAVAGDSHKTPLFSLDERVAIAEAVFDLDASVMVEGFSGLLVNYVKRRGANVILRGMRAVSDFEFEFQMALMNRKLDRSIETVFIMTDYQWLYISSTIVKEVAKHGGEIRGMVPELVRERVLEKFGLGGADKGA
ncbi:pantetheine-phosphate adenylyltransferase [Solidesulfovibrio sp.]|jgi:pantetheine-phosphate adenylyltransferase|uniref:pantetheine-phosphate adenylyltransferase n=1 Tax=Solidesulfovibrio sp. TaxID=2910990 RepID=UPI002B20BB94|nr:pantetheine-phosphate adenylyltransferase [Solidesulfovibrio sp.]MEA5088482.1 pantetheine-phosphate adenylyltransferase [Solidesulfovibrio sp.]